MSTEQKTVKPKRKLGGAALKAQQAKLQKEQEQTNDGNRATAPVNDDLPDVNSADVNGNANTQAPNQVPYTDDQINKSLHPEAGVKANKSENKTAKNQKVSQLRPVAKQGILAEKDGVQRVFSETSWNLLATKNHQTGGINHDGWKIVQDTPAEVKKLRNK